MTWLWSLKTTTIFVHGPYFDPMTPPLGVLKSQSRVPAVLALLFWRFECVHAVHPVGIPLAFVHVVHPVR